MGSQRKVYTLGLTQENLANIYNIKFSAIVKIIKEILALLKTRGKKQPKLRSTITLLLPKEIHSALAEARNSNKTVGGEHFESFPTCY